MSTCGYSVHSEIVRFSGDFLLTPRKHNNRIRVHVRPQITVRLRGVSMDQRYSTIIFVPHARPKFRKLKVSHRLLFSIVSLVTSSLCLSTFFSIQYFTSLSQNHELNKLQRENRELKTANE